MSRSVYLTHYQNTLYEVSFRGPVLTDLLSSDFDESVGFRKLSGSFPEGGPEVFACLFVIVVCARLLWFVVFMVCFKCVCIACCCVLAVFLLYVVHISAAPRGRWSEDVGLLRKEP